MSNRIKGKKTRELNQLLIGELANCAKSFTS